MRMERYSSKRIRGKRGPIQDESMIKPVRKCLKKEHYTIEEW